MKPMVYKRWCPENIDTLDEGIYKNFHYAIISLGSHPCAYVELPREHKYYGLEYDDIPIECHYGLTYSSNDGIVFPAENENHKDGFWIGWDYAHLGDYVYNSFYSCSHKEKQWTTEEIFEEVKDVIEQLVIKT